MSTARTPSLCFRRRAAVRLLAAAVTLMLAGVLVALVPAPTSAAGGDVVARMSPLPSGGRSATCGEPATVRVNSARGEVFVVTFVNQKFHAASGSWRTLGGTQGFKAKTNTWHRFTDVVFGGCGFGKGKFRLVARTTAYDKTRTYGSTTMHPVGRDRVVRAYRVD